MWHDLLGEVKQYAGTAGTVTIGAGEVVILVIVHASAGSATASILGGANIPIINGANPLSIQMYHTLFQADGGGSNNTLVFTNTDMYYVQTVKEAHA